MKSKPRFRYWIKLTSLLLATALASAACSDSSGYVYVSPAETEEVGPGLWQIELTESAAQRTGLETVETTMRDIDGEERLVVPYSAVAYHFDGSTWTYTNPSPLTYIRAPIEIDYIDRDIAVLFAGPAVGTDVVSVGVAELYGVEFGIGK